MSGLGQRFLGLLIGLDQGANALLGGSDRETLSGSVGRSVQAGRWWALRIAQPAINALLLNPQHCQEAAADEAARRAAELPLSNPAAKPPS